MNSLAPGSICRRTCLLGCIVSKVLINTVITNLNRSAPDAEEPGFVIPLRTLLQRDHRHILEWLDVPALKIRFDAGNSARMGYDVHHLIQSRGVEKRL